MKKLILAAIVSGLMTAMSYAQGTLVFQSAGNVAGNIINAPITNSVQLGGVRASGAAYSADLLYFAGTTSSAASLLDLGLAVAFNTGGQAGYFNGGSATLPNGAAFAVGQTITVQVVAFTAGHTFAEASAAGSGLEWFRSNLINVTLSSSSGTPAGLVGLLGGQMTLNAVPEPTTIALGGLGAAALLLFRRRK